MGKEQKKALVIRITKLLLCSSFIICCVTEICRITTLQFVSTVNYTTCIPSLFAQSVGRSIKNRRRLVNPGKQSKLSGVRASLEDNFCFYSSPISIDLLMLTLIGSFYGESFLEAFSHSSWQINACSRSKLTGNYNTFWGAWGGR